MSQLISRKNARQFLEWVERVSDTPILRIAIAEVVATGDILGISVQCEGRSFGQGIQVISPFSEALVSYIEDGDGNLWWSAYDDSTPSYGSVRARWSSRDGLTEGDPTEQVGFPAEIDPVAALERKP